MRQFAVIAIVCVVVIGVGAVSAEKVHAQAAAFGNTVATNPNSLPDVNLKIVRFCESKLGQKVGTGECAVLASESLKASGAVPRLELPDPTPPMKEDDYVWGTQLKPSDSFLPGDILQFRDTVLKYHYPDGSSRTQRMPHHTAIIYKVVGPGQFVVLHQNIGRNDATDEERKRVKSDPLDIRGLQGGTIWAYRPKPKGS